MWVATSSPSELQGLATLAVTGLVGPLDQRSLGWGCVDLLHLQVARALVAGSLQAVPKARQQAVRVDGYPQTRVCIVLASSGRKAGLSGLALQLEKHLR